MVRGGVEPGTSSPAPAARSEAPPGGANGARGALGRALRLGLYVAPLVIASALRIPVCPQAILTGTPCPGCGMTRALFALASGDLHLAQIHNPIAVAVWPVVLALSAYHAAAYVVTGRSRLDRAWARNTALTLSAALTVIWIARMFGLFGGPVPV